MDEHHELAAFYRLNHGIQVQSRTKGEARWILSTKKMLILMCKSITPFYPKADPTSQVYFPYKIRDFL